MHKYLMELIGTFFLFFTIGCVVVPEVADGVGPLAVGAVLMGMIFAGGHVSGAHYNPAVTLAFLARGKCLASDVLPYMAAQFTGALGAAGVVIVMYGRADALVIEDTGAVFCAELLFTFALVFVIMHVATARGTSGNMFYGVAISMIVVAGAYSVGSISGAAFNPAVVVGAAILGLLSLSDVWLYLIANFLGAVLGVVLYRATDRS